MTEQSSSQSDNGSFWTGFSVGMLAGAVSYFLFATDKGEKVRKELKDEWHQAQKQTIEPAGQAAAVSIRTLIKDVIDQVTTRFDLQEKKSKNEAAKVVVKKKKEPAKTLGKFKGV